MDVKVHENIKRELIDFISCYYVNNSSIPC